MNAARIATSPRLQRVDQFLSDGLWHSTREIIQGAQVCAVNSCIAELRQNDRHIVGHWKSKVFYYRMVAKKAVA